jgi:N-acetyl-anhydromuramyl-L-alanine amidase AmpD
MIEKPYIEEFKTFAQLKKRTVTDKIVVHCSATQCLDKYDRKTIEQMHRQNGWTTIGYHYVIKKDGTIQEGRPLDTIGAHVKGENSHTVGVCLIGGTDAKGKSVFNYSDEQMVSLKLLLDWLRSVYLNVPVCGHRDFKGVAKDCPCFDVEMWYEPKATYVVYDHKKGFKSLLSQVDFLRANNGQTEFEDGDIVRIE